MPPRPPDRFSLRAFRIYETAIQTITLNFPNDTTISPDPYSAETFSARIRDAITAYISPGNAWQSVVDRETLRRIRPLIVFIHDGESVLCTLREVAKANRLRERSGGMAPQFATQSGRSGTLGSRGSGSFPARTSAPSGADGPQSHQGTSAASLPPASGAGTHNPSETFLLTLLGQLSRGETDGPITLTGTVPTQYLEDALNTGAYDVEMKTQPDQSVLLF